MILNASTALNADNVTLNEAGTGVQVLHGTSIWRTFPDHPGWEDDMVPFEATHSWIRGF